MTINVLFNRKKAIHLFSFLIMTFSVELTAQFGPKPDPISPQRVFELAKAKKVGDVSMNHDGVIYEIIVNNATKTVTHKIISLRNLRNVGQQNYDYYYSGFKWDQIVQKDPLWKKDPRWKMPSKDDLLAVYYSNRSLINKGLKQKLKWSGNNRKFVDLLDCSIDINGRKCIRAGFISKEWGGMCGKNISVVGITSPECNTNVIASGCVPIQEFYYGPNECYIKNSDLAYFVRLVKEEIYVDPSEVEKLKKLVAQKNNEDRMYWSNIKAKKIGDAGIQKDGIIYDVVYNLDSSLITHKILALQNLRDVRDGRQILAIKDQNWPELFRLRSVPKIWKMPVFNDLKIVAKHVERINEGLKTQKKSGLNVDLISCNVDVRLGTGKIWNCKRGGLICSIDPGQAQLVSGHYFICPISLRQCAVPKNGKRLAPKQFGKYPGYGEFVITFNHDSNIYAYTIRFVKEEVYKNPM